VSDVVTTASLMAYMKALIQELDQRKVANMVLTTTHSTTYEDVLNITDKGVLTRIPHIKPKQCL